MSGFAHFIHFIITLFFWPWIIVWILCAAIQSGNKTDKKMCDLQKQNNELLRKLYEKEKWK